MHEREMFLMDLIERELRENAGAMFLLDLMLGRARDQGDDELSGELSAMRADVSAAIDIDQSAYDRLRLPAARQQTAKRSRMPQDARSPRAGRVAAVHHGDNSTGRG